MFRLDEAMPDVAEELHLCFRKVNRPDLAEQVWELEIVDRCPCDDDFCATFYTQPNEPWHGKVERFVPDIPGLICVHIVNGHVARVELLDRPDVRDQLRKWFPLSDQHI